MLITIQRKPKSNSTPGALLIDGVKFCDTMEDVDRGLLSTMTLQEIQSKKIYGDTAIPKGKYRFNIDVVSPKFKDRQWAKFCGGKLPRLENVPGFEGVLIHVGNTPKDTLGCLLVGVANSDTMITNSVVTFQSLYKKIEEAKARGEELWIEIV